MSVDFIKTKSLKSLLKSLESGSRPRGGVSGINDGIPSIGAEHLTSDGSFNFKKIKYIPTHFAASLRRGLIRRGDILIVKDGATTGKVSYVDNQFPFEVSYVNEHVFICRSSDDMIGKFLYYYLRSDHGNSQIMSTFHGAAQGGISSIFANEVVVPVPILEDQQKIVNQLDSILPRLKTVKDRLNRIPQLLKKFRQGILSAACSGRLTEDWRIKKSLNSEWDEMALAEIAESISTGPFGTMLHKSDYIKNGIPVINPTNIISNEIIPDLSVTVCSEKAQELSRYLLKENDIILSRRGDLSKCGLVSKQEVGWLAGTGTFIVRVKMIPHFFRMVFQNPATQELIYNGSIGSTMPNLNQGILGALKVPNPSPEEQQEIVNQVDRLFNMADSLVTKYWIAVARIDKIEQSVLAKAFRGELVEPDPDFKLTEKLDECVTQNIEHLC